MNNPIRRRRIAPAVLLLLLVPAAARAQAGAERITFRDAVRIALERNSTLARSENALLLEQIAVSEARMQFFPDLRLSLSAGENFGRTFSESEGRILSQTNQSVSAGLSSSLVLFNGFARKATLRAALLDLEAGGRDTRRARQTVVFLVISGYLSVIEADAQHRVAEENLASQRDQEVLVRELVDGGKNPISDLYQQQANVARADLALVSARRTLELARIDLVQTLQLDPAREYAFDAPALPDSVEPGPDPVLSDLLARAFASRADLNALEARLAASAEGEKAAAGGYWPSLTLSGGYRSSYSSGSSDRDLFQQLDDRRSGSVSLGLSFPIFDRFSTRRSVRRARIGTENARIALADRRQAVALEVRRAVLDEESARESLNAARAQLRAANRALEATRQRYEAGASTLHEVTLSRADLVEAQSSRVSAAYTLLWQRHVRDYYVGVLDPGATAMPWAQSPPER
jgi:outer membrane protein